MQKLKAVIFDIDGTLTSTNELIFATFNFMTRKYLNNSMTDREIISLFGPTEEMIIEKWFPDKHNEVKNDYYNFYANNHHMASLYDGIEDLIRYLKSAQMILTIFTGKGRRTSEITLEKLKLLQYFDLIVTGSDVINHKPHHEGLEKILSHFNLNRDEVIFIGDSSADIKAANAANISIASVVWDSYEKELVKSLNPNLCFESVQALSQYLMNL